MHFSFDKNIRNALFRKGNDFHCPRLELCTGFVLEAGVCSVKWTRDLCHKNENKMTSNVRMHKNVACVDNLSKLKVLPALALFTREMTTALEDECDGLASGRTIFENDERLRDSTPFDS